MPPQTSRWKFRGNRPDPTQQQPSSRWKFRSRTPEADSPQGDRSDLPSGLSEARQTEYSRWRRAGFPNTPELYPTFTQPKQWSEKGVSEHIGDAIESLASDLNPVSIVKGLATAVRHLPTTVKTLVGAQADQFRKAREAGSQGRYSEMLGHGVASTIPLLGPAAAEMGERIGRGEVGSGIGSAIGLALPGAVAKGYGRLRGTGSGVASPRVVMSAGERLRAKGSISAPLVTKAEAVSRKLISSEGRFHRLRAVQQNQISDWANQVVEGISPTAGKTSSLSAGRKAQVSLREALEEAKDSIGQEYAAIDDLTRVTHTQQLAVRAGVPHKSRYRADEIEQLDVASGGVVVPKATMKEFAKEALTELDEVAKHISTSDLRAMQSQLREIIAGPNFADFKTYQGIRTTLHDLTKSSDLAIGGRSQGLTKKLVQISSKAMQDAAEGSGIPGLGKRIEKANATWKQLKETFNDSIVAKLQKANPEEVHRLFERASLDDLDVLKQQLPRHQWDELRAKLLQDAINRSTRGELTKRLGIAEDVAEESGIVTGQRESMSFSPSQLNRWQENTLDVGRLEKLFTKKELVDINAIIETADLIFGSTGQSANALGFLATGLNVGMTAGWFASPSVGATTAASTYLLGRILTHQATRSKLLDQLGKAARRRGVQRGVSVAPVLSRESNRQQEDRQEAMMPPQSTRATGRRRPESVQVGQVSPATTRTMADILP